MLAGFIAGIVVANYTLTIGTRYRSVLDWHRRAYQPVFKHRRRA